jgi:hypothetical protein
MSLLDRTLDPLPRRAKLEGRSTHSAFGWFSNDTVRSAQRYDDVSWARLCCPALIAVLLLGWAEAMAGSDLQILLRIAGITGLTISAWGLSSRLLGQLRRKD